ncbi:DUF4167 domain-containing protein [Sphingomonas sp. LaA6.9]|nr:DUF4167 domain-containing protein [Sphingomonas sp. LaA6.9]MCJ8158342.1 DUF4167 domain-containing protein [Sphingomonas sp. LaA6.9]
MMNNRQSGRRRGRGGQRPQSGQGRPDQGNRIDNRARGNAAQLHEKYKNLARDAQTQGDRVMAEYYFQFADHYFRVLNEGRARFEENRRQRDDIQDDEDLGDDIRADDAQDETTGDQVDQDDQDDYRRQRRDRNRDRAPRREVREYAADQRADEDDARGNVSEAPEATEATEAQAPQPASRARAGLRPRRNAKADTNGHAVDATAELSLGVDRLPPALSPAAEEQAPAPKPRTRRPRKSAEAEASVEG